MRKEELQRQDDVSDGRHQGAGGCSLNQTPVPGQCGPGMHRAGRGVGGDIPSQPTKPLSEPCYDVYTTCFDATSWKQTSSDLLNSYNHYRITQLYRIK